MAAVCSQCTDAVVCVQGTAPADHQPVVRASVSCPKIVAELLVSRWLQDSNAEL